MGHLSIGSLSRFIRQTDGERSELLVSWLLGEKGQARRSDKILQEYPRFRPLWWSAYYDLRLDGRLQRSLIVTM